MCQGLLPSRRHIEKREDPGDEVEDPGTQQNHVTKISNEDGNVFKMAAKAK